MLHITQSLHTQCRFISAHTSDNCWASLAFLLLVKQRLRTWQELKFTEKFDRFSNIITLFNKKGLFWMGMKEWRLGLECSFKTLQDQGRAIKDLTFDSVLWPTAMTLLVSIVECTSLIAAFNVARFFLGDFAVIFPAWIHVLHVQEGTQASDHHRHVERSESARDSYD